MAGRYTGTLPAYSIMSTGLGGGTSRLDLGTEAYRKKERRARKINARTDFKTKAC